MWLAQPDQARLGRAPVPPLTVALPSPHWAAAAPEQGAASVNTPSSCELTSVRVCPPRSADPHLRQPQRVLPTDTEKMLNSLIVRETQTRTTARHHLTPVRMAVVNKSAHTRAGEGVGNREPSGAAGGNAAWCGRRGQRGGVPQEISGTALWPGKSTSGCMFKETLTLI